VLSVAFRSDGRMVSASDDGTVRLRDPRTGRLRDTFPDSTYGATVFTPDGRTLATSSLGRGVELWDTA
jgi:WD40 repeat protein